LENLTATLLSHITPERGSTEVRSLRAVADELNMSKSTIQRLVSDLPLRDISNTSHTQQRASLHQMLKAPAAFVTPTTKPSNSSYLTLTEEELLLKIISDKALNESSIGKTAIRNHARDIKHARVKGEHEKVKLPSNSWFKEFRARHKDRFKSKKASKKEYKRADAERSDEIREWFDVLKGHYDQYDFESHHIFGMDETGISGEASLNEKVMVPIEYPVAVQLTGSFREHVSVMHICHAAGVTLPPIFMFQGTWMHKDIHRGAPTGSRVAMQDAGYFEKQHLKAVFQHIVEYTDQHKEQYYHVVDGQEQRRQILLILDGAKVHLCPAALKYAVQHRMTVVRLPPHMTHYMQASDVACFSPFKLAYAMACEEWRQQHRAPITKYNICAIVATAWARSMTKDNVISGFRRTGQWPWDPNQVLDQVCTRTHTHSRSFAAERSPSFSPSFVVARRRSQTSRTLTQPSNHRDDITTATASIGAEGWRVGGTHQGIGSRASHNVVLLLLLLLSTFHASYRHPRRLHKTQRWISSIKEAEEGEEGCRHAQDYTQRRLPHCARTHQGIGRAGGEPEAEGGSKAEEEGGGTGHSQAAQSREVSCYQEAQSRGESSTEAGCKAHEEHRCMRTSLELQQQQLHLPEAHTAGHRSERRRGGTLLTLYKPSLPHLPPLPHLHS
jgi:hypothetical protein